MSRRFSLYSSKGKIIKICQTQTKRTSSCHRKIHSCSALHPLPRLFFNAHTNNQSETWHFKRLLQESSWRLNPVLQQSSLSGPWEQLLPSFISAFLFLFCFWHRGFFFSPSFFVLSLSWQKHHLLFWRNCPSHTFHSHLCERGLFSGAEAGWFYSCSVPVSHWLDK